jgi:hypothetical protein
VNRKRKNENHKMNYPKSLVMQLVKDNSENNPRDNRYIRVSSIGDCSRKIAYSVLGYQSMPTSGHFSFVLSLGNSIHDMIQAQLVNMGWIKAEPFWNSDRNILDWKQTDDPESGCELEVVDHNLRVLGHLDGITVPMKKISNGNPDIHDYIPAPDDPEAERYLIEIKSISDRPTYWLNIIDDGGKHTICEADFELSLATPDITESSSGKRNQRIGKYLHERIVVNPWGKSIKYPVHEIQIGGTLKAVTVIRQGLTLGAFSQIKEPKPVHLAQASMYAKCKGIKKILFLYVGKDVDQRTYEDPSSLTNFPIKIFEREVDDFTTLVLESKISEIYKKTDEGQLPPRDYDWGSNECEFCQFKWTCWNSKVDLPEINTKLKDLGLKSLVDGPGKTHKPKSDLRQEFEDQKPS